MPKETAPGRAWHQRARAEDGEHEYAAVAVTSIGGLSPAAYNFLGHWAWGSSSAWEVELARSIANTFEHAPAGLENLSSCGSYGRKETCSDWLGCKT